MFFTHLQSTVQIYEYRRRIKLLFIVQNIKEFYRIEGNSIEKLSCFTTASMHSAFFEYINITSDCILLALCCAVTAFGDVLGTSFLVIVFAVLYYVFRIGTLTT